ncbi:hypothetical protein GWN65_05770 [Candidatus Bathyarchaeota archaeon]|nr:hypothetical protein [Candidatus Bathyarchaeota archaeon]NIW34639.1 hypothetical protein [Candidatus Bathyarchaeota archaeon]
MVLHRALLKLILQTDAFRHFFILDPASEPAIADTAEEIGARSIASPTIGRDGEPHQDMETCTVQALAIAEEAETLIAWG